MALSGVNQSHVQPVWAEILSHSADIGVHAVPRLFAASPNNNIASDILSALPAQNLLTDPINLRLPNQYLLAAMDVNGPGVSVSIDSCCIGIVLTSKYR
ncbi:Hypothetical predicted protein [Podarcis lilfordi]|uniref:Uncharacterized protein n=1 Tax=Podarcis lilfordi TaxID=74358 RepID=A0AA35LCP4_9SAUR|nr:Hypothetical predicted protein [Podarcis lilfordi]